MLFMLGSCILRHFDAFSLHFARLVRHFVSIISFMNILFKFLTLTIAIIISPFVALGIATITFVLALVGFINGTVEALTVKPAVKEPEEPLGVWEKYVKDLEEKNRNN